ncbi:MAG: adenylate/guanylate cyclase domain-containing protein [Verrucomicrobiota bacterium]
MASFLIRRYYPIPDLSFRDFWDICSRFQTVHPEYRHVYFTVDGYDSFLVLDEPDVSSVLKKLEGKEKRVRKYAARFYTSRTQHAEGYGISELQYRPVTYERYPQGLSFYSDSVSKSTYYQFEEELYTSYPFIENNEPEVEFGKPCEVLALVIDIRGFSLFCEEPNIESPYICGLMSAFYHMVTRSLQRFPPEMTKFVGDGVIAIWETTPADREIAVNVGLKTALELSNDWAKVKDSPHFTHGAPEEIGAGICFGLASHLEVGDDYIGRPINIASRLCSACPGDRVFVDRSVPSIPLHLKKEEQSAHIKPYGRHNVWSFRNARGTNPPFLTNSPFDI